MHKSFLSWTLLSYLACGLAAVALEGCGCFDGEDSARDSCRELTAAVNHVRVSCNLPETDDVAVCGTVCSGPAGCQDRTDVRTCAYAIEELSCDDISVTERYRNLVECAAIFSDIAHSCDESDSGDSHDFDDDDF